MKALPRLAAIAALALVSACSTGGGGGALSPGLSARMDAPGARLDTAQALGIINQYRATTGAPPLAADAALAGTAQSLAASYAQGSKSPATPAGSVAMLTSAGYPNFAETFSGWRNSPKDAAVLANRSATRAGVAATYDPNSGYGVYWVLVLDD